MVYDGIHEGYADLVFYKQQADYKIEYVINSMLFSRRKNKNNAQINSTILTKLKNEKEIDNAKNEVLKNNKVDAQLIEKVVEYKKASFNPSIPEYKKNNGYNKSKYDIEYNK